MGRGGLTAALEGSARLAFDTNSCIYYLRAERSRGVLVRELIYGARRGLWNVSLSGIVYLELLVRPYRSRDEQELLKVRQLALFTDGFDVTPLTSALVELGAHVRAETALKTPDALILASAIVAGCDVLIGNDKRFARINPRPGADPPSIRYPRYVHLDDYVDDNDTGR